MWPPSVRRWHVVLAVGAGCLALFLSAPADSLLQVCAWFVPLVLAVGLLALRVGDRRSARHGPMLVLLGAQVLYLVTSVFWYVGPVVFAQSLPFPSFVDAMYFTSYGGYAVFLLMLLRGRVRDRGVESRIALTDALILTVSMSMLLWVTVISPDMTSGGVSWSTAVAVLYPLLTLLLFGLAARLVMEGELGRSVPGVLLLVWIGAEIVGDSLYGLQSANGTFAYSSPLSVAWIVSGTALAARAAHPAASSVLVPGQTRAVRAGGHLSSAALRNVRLAMMSAAAVFPIVVLWVDRGDSLIVLGGAVLTVVLVIFRASLLAGDLQKERRLGIDLEDAAAVARGQRDQLREQARELKRLAFHDLVTGLGNRAMLHERATMTRESLGRTALLLLDLDGFKAVNDTLGHAAGDALLLQVGDRLGRCVRTFDTVVRLGGDEFALLLYETGAEAAMSTAQRVLRELRVPFSVNAVSVRVAGSIGVTTGERADDLDVMLRDADLAMYEAKSAGRDRAHSFEPGMHERATREMTLGADLREGLVRDEFVVYYQPLVHAGTGEVSSVEALVRWDHPDRGVLSPSEFVPVAERSGVIVELGRFVLRTACDQVAGWRQDWPDLCVAVNVSHRELLHPGFAEHVLAVLAESGLPADALHLEITETVLAAEESINASLEPLSTAGVRFSIDDFGTGHSSLSRLRSLNVDRLKIDKSFISEIVGGGYESAPLLASIIAMAHSVGHIVVAEGVETDQQAAFLTAHGCDELQGYLFSRPIAADQVIPVLLTNATSHRKGCASHNVFPAIIGRIMGDTEPLDSVLPNLLRELTAVSGLQCMFITDVRDAPTTPVQVTSYAHNNRPDILPIEEGMKVDWPRTLCKRMLDDNVVWTDNVAQQYGDIEVVNRLGLETYITIPVLDDVGVLCGTLCGASSEGHTIAPSIVELMHLFAQALGDRLVRHPNGAHLLR